MCIGQKRDKMKKRFLIIWFRHLKTDWMIRHNAALKDVPFVLVRPEHGRIKVSEVSAVAYKKGITPGMPAADAKIILPSLHTMNDDPLLAAKLLKKLCHWAIRFTPSAAIDEPDGLVLDATGCAYLWGGEENYLKEVSDKLTGFGYHIRIAMADTIGAAWALSRYGKEMKIIPAQQQKSVLASLPPAGLRLEKDVLERLHKLGLYRIGSFMDFGRSALRRRFGEALVTRLDQALGNEEERIEPLLPPEPYEERLVCFEPIVTRKGIEIALEKLLNTLCDRLKSEGKGMRSASFKCCCIDGRMEEVNISTNCASVHLEHLFKLFEIKLSSIKPGLGIELFILNAPLVQELNPVQISFWSQNSGLKSDEVSRLFDRIQAKFGKDSVRRFLPAAHHTPERSCRPAESLNEKPSIPWRTHRRRPIQLLPRPEKIRVTAPVPDYPPMNFQFRGKLHMVKKADGPERIEPEWWLETGLPRDYYTVEDEDGKRYWIFRLGQYEKEEKPEWFVHGFFA